MDKNKTVLLKNTIMLYILTFSTYILSFITVPYQTRILTPEKYGIIGLAMAIMAYFQLVVDFGFLISATAEISKVRDDKHRVSKIFSSVMWVKIFLSVLSFIVLAILCAVVKQWTEYFFVLVLYLIATVINSLIPDYLYRGLEKMEAVTVRAVLIKVFFTIMIFIVVKAPEDYVLIPVLNIIGNSVAFIAVLIHMRLKLKLGFVKCSIREVFYEFKSSLFFFFSRIATTLYSATNTVVLNLMSGGIATAYYTSSNQVVNAARGGMSPIADSLYPYMIRNRDFKLVKKIILLLEPLIIVGCTVVFIFAKPLCIWVFGAEYAQSAYALRAMLPVIAITLPTYVFGFPVLGAMGLNKHVNYSTIIGAVFHVIGLIILAVMGMINIVSLGIMTSITEFLILGYRLTVVAINRKTFKTKEQATE